MKWKRQTSVIEGTNEYKLKPEVIGRNERYNNVYWTTEEYVCFKKDTNLQYIMGFDLLSFEVYQMAQSL